MYIIHINIYLNHTLSSFSIRGRSGSAAPTEPARAPSAPTTTTAPREAPAGMFPPPGVAAPAAVTTARGSGGAPTAETRTAVQAESVSEFGAGVATGAIVPAARRLEAPSQPPRALAVSGSTVLGSTATDRATANLIPTSDSMANRPVDQLATAGPNGAAQPTAAPTASRVDNPIGDSTAEPMAATTAEDMAGPIPTTTVGCVDEPSGTGGGGGGPPPGRTGVSDAGLIRGSDTKGGPRGSDTGGGMAPARSPSGSPAPQPRVAGKESSSPPGVWRPATWQQRNGVAHSEFFHGEGGPTEVKWYMCIYV